MPLDATPAGPNANSYVTVAEATEFVEAIVPTAVQSVWTDLGVATQERLLKQATLRFEQLAWKGARATEAQALAQPRSGLSIDGRAVDDETVPVPIRRATAIYAYKLAENPDLPVTDAEAGGLDQFQQVSIGPISATLRDGATGAGPLDDLPTVVSQWLIPYLRIKSTLLRSFPVRW